MKTQPYRFVTLVLALVAIGLVLGGCSEAVNSDSADPSVGQPPAASQQSESAAELRSRSGEFRQYMEENFGGGYGQDPVSWYSSIKSMEFTDSNHLVIKTNLKPTNESNARSIITAVKFYEDLPANVRILGTKGVVLFASD